MGLCLSTLIKPAFSDVIDSWQNYVDEEYGITLKYPWAHDDLVCGKGKYGAPYDTQFGCKSSVVKLLVLPWKNTKGIFEINVQNQIVQAGPEKILGTISEKLPEFGYRPMPPVSVAGLEAIRFERINPGREIWYLLKDDLLVEINITYRPSQLRPDAHKEQLGTLRKIATTLEFAL